MESINNKQKDNLINKKTKILIISLMSLFLVLVISGLFYITYSSLDKDRIEISSEEDDYKDRARQKLLAMTGKSYEEYKTYKMRNGDQNYSSFSPEVAARKLSNEIAPLEPQETNQVYYSKVEFNLYSHDSKQVIMGENIDMSKPFIEEYWNSGQYYKTIRKQGNKLFNFSSSMPNESYTYLGGKYAIKTVYDSQNYAYAMTGVGFSGSIEDPNLSFLTSLLESENVKEIGMEKIDGREVVVFEEEYEDLGDNIPLDKTVTNEQDNYGSELENNENFDKVVWATKYFVDLDSFELKKTEYYKNSEIQSSVLVLESKIYESKDESGIFDLGELKNIDIKVVNYSGRVSPSNSLSYLSKEKNIYYIENDVLERGYFYGEDEYSKLSTTKDFDPSYDESQITYPSAIYEYYSEKGISYSIYNENPSASNKYFVTFDSKNNESIKKRDIFVNLNGQKWPALLITETYPMNDVSCEPVQSGEEGTEVEKKCEEGFAYEANHNFVILEVEGKWLEIRFYEISVDVDNINLILLTTEKALEFDKRIQEQIQNYEDYSEEGYFEGSEDVMGSGMEGVPIKE